MQRQFGCELSKSRLLSVCTFIVVSFYIGFGGESGHTDDFRGWFDYFMDFWFYLPNLVVVEIILAEYKFFQIPGVKITGAILLLLASAFLLFASFFFIRDFWGPGILSGF